MGVATTTDTTNSVRTSFGILKTCMYGISVQVNETTKKKKRNVHDLKKVLKLTQSNIFNPRPAGVWIVTRPAGGGGGLKGHP